MAFRVTQNWIGQAVPAFLGSFKLLLLLGLTGCQIGYIAKSAYYQADLLRRRIPLEEALTTYTFDNSQRENIQLAINVRQFMQHTLKLNVDKNYGMYTQLDRDYVTYAVSAAPKDRLEHHTWTFPIVGSVPYKGYFQPKDAKAEAQLLEDQGLDVYVRGISAYSTLGWFSDPLLSSMLSYKSHRLVDTLIHETIHANLYIKGASNFNERVASYLAKLGTEQFYKNTDTDIRAVLENEGHDSTLFSGFITEEIRKLKAWYVAHAKDADLQEKREIEFQHIQKRFQNDVLPKMKTNGFAFFSKIELNNARLLLYDLYMAEYSDFEAVAKKRGRNFKAMYSYLKTLENFDDPISQLKRDGTD